MFSPQSSATTRRELLARILAGVGVLVSPLLGFAQTSGTQRRQDRRSDRSERVQERSTERGDRVQQRDDKMVQRRDDPVGVRGPQRREDHRELRTDRQTDRRDIRTDRQTDRQERIF